MNIKKKPSVLIGSLLLIGAMVLGDTVFWQGWSGEDSPGRSEARFVSKNNKIVARENEQRGNSKNKKGGSGSSFSWQVAQTNSDRNHDENEKEKRNNMLRFWKPALRHEDEDTINDRINHVSQWNRLEFLIRVIGKIAKLEMNISNSNMPQDRKTRYLDMLEAIRFLIQQRIDELTSGSGSTVDVTPPTVNAFSLVGVNESTATFTTNISEAGSGYYVVLASGSVAPTAEQVRLGENASWSVVTLHGSRLLASGTNTFSASDLLTGQTYVMYFAVADTHGNLQTAVFSFTFTTTNTVDVTPPALSSLMMSGVTSTGANLLFTSTEWGTGYYVLLASGSAAPSAAQVKFGQDATSSAAAKAGTGVVLSGANTFALSGLTPNTAYVAYIVAQDTSGNLGVVSSTTFTTATTPDTTPPTLSAFSASGTTASGTTLSINSSESGTGYYVILPAGSGAPSAAQVKLWQDASSAVTSIKWMMAMPSGNSMFSVTGLPANMTLTAYFTAEDMSGNLQSTVQSVTFITPSM